MRSMPARRSLDRRDRRPDDRRAGRDRRACWPSRTPTRPPSSSVWWSATTRRMSLMRQAVIALQDAEIGQRAYLLTGDIADLEPYERRAAAHRDRACASSKRPRPTIPTRRGRSREFRAAASEKLERAQRHHRRLSALRPRRYALAQERTAGRATSDQIRQVADAFIEGQTAAAGPPAGHAALRAGAVRHRRAAGAGRRVRLPDRRHGHHHARRRAAGDARSASSSARSQLLQTTLESLQDPIFVIDAEGRVVAWNEPFVAALPAGIPAGRRRLTRDQLLSDRLPAMRALLRAAEARRPQKQSG